MNKLVYQKDKSLFLTKNPFLANIYRPPICEHSHDYFEFSFCIKNKCKCVVNGKEFEFSHGTCALARPTDVHAYKNIPKCKFGDYQHADIYVKADKMESICNLLSKTLFSDILSADKPIVFSLSSSLMKTVIQQINLILSTKNTSPICDTVHTTIVTLLLSRYCEENYFFSSNSKRPEWLSKLIVKLSSLDYMLLSVPKIAADVGYSPEYLSREFHRHMKITLRKYIIQKKMEYASTIMAVNDLKIIDLAQILGYSNPSNFSKNFQEVFNCTPVEYQQELASLAPIQTLPDEQNL